MSSEYGTSRKLKRVIEGLLAGDDPEQAFREIMQLPARQVIGPLFGHFLHKEALIRWRAITAMGMVVSDMADGGEMEAARVVMRRLMWSLNDESGGIGWGSPEAMGEITARHQRLADEFHRILTSYTMVEGNYLEHEVLQRGLLWGIGRLAHARPELIAYVLPHLEPFLESPDPIHRGLSVWAAGPLANARTKTLINALGDDNAEITLYTDGRLHSRTVADLVRDALNSDP